MILIYSLIGCPFSENGEKLLKEINHEVIKINHDEKQKWNVINGMTTYPQIFYRKSNGDKIKIGGYTELNSIMDKIKASTDKNNILQEIQNFLNINEKDAKRILVSLF